MAMAIAGGVHHWSRPPGAPWQVRGVWVLAGTGTESHDKFRKTLRGAQCGLGPYSWQSLVAIH